MTFLPIVERELRVASRWTGTYWTRFFAALGAMLIFLFILLGGNSRRPPSMVAQEMFTITRMMIWFCCMFVGVFQTADCLSSEKREGTMGLLFLTDLRGFDVVLGKLAATSLTSFYGLLSTIPVLAMPLLMGGITVGEFWRMVLVLVVALFFSLGIGMAVSACSRESRQPIGISMFIIILLTGILPAIYGLIKMLAGTGHLHRVLLWPSLGYAASRSADAYYNYRGGPHEFWGSLLVAFGLGCGGLILASIILPRTWQEKQQAGPVGRKDGGRWRRLRFAGARYSEVARLRLATNAFSWLAMRDRLPQIGFWGLAIVALPFWMLFFGGAVAGGGIAKMNATEIAMFITIGFGLCFKCMVAMEASRRLNEDRQSGALELLLVTPLSEKEIVAGQRQALNGIFLMPLFVVLALYACVMWWSCSSKSPVHDQGVTAIIMFGNMVVLFTDFFALGWVGMLNGLIARQHHRAVLVSLVQILVLPWLLYVVMGVCGGFNSSIGAIAFFIMWYLMGVLNDLIWARWARNKLRREFRLRAAGAVIGKRSLRVGAELEPAVA